MNESFPTRLKESTATFMRDLQFAYRSLMKTKGLTLAVILTLALGIGANSAIFTVVRGVLLRPLENRDEDRLVYIHQSARGIGAEDVAFSVPEIIDLRSGVKSLSAIGDFSTIGFTMIGLGEPREVRAGVVGGSYFDVMGLHPILGRLIDQRDDGPKADGVAVLTYRFWSGSLKSDPGVIGKVIRLSSRSATVIGVLEPSTPYPQETELFANVVTSPHHLSATMVTGRVHRMTELFGRLAPGVSLESAKAELQTVHARMVKDYPDGYPPRGDFRIDAVRLRDQVTSRAKSVLLVLLAASALIFIIACSNVANLILARTVRREGELAIRAALGAGTGALRRTLLAESLLLGGAGALVGVLSAWPLVAVLAKFASRFSVRAMDLKVDSSMVWVGALLAIGASVLLAFIPRLPSSDSARGGPSLANGGVRITSATNRSLRAFAITQIAACFVLLASAGMLLKTLLALYAVPTGFDTQRVLALNVPSDTNGRTPEQIAAFFRESIRQINALPGVDAVAAGTVVPWRDAGSFGPGLEFSVEGASRATGEDNPRARFRTISPGFFAALGIPIIAGRDFNDSDRRNGEPVVIISQSVAQRMFPNQDAVNRHLIWTDPVMKFIDISPAPRRIIGIAKDVDDENIVPGPAMTVYHTMDQVELWGGRVFVHTHTDPHGLVVPVTRIIRGLAVDQPVERAATLEDIRAEVLTPDRLTTMVFGIFAAVALAIAVVGVGGLLAFLVSGKTREFGIRLALGSQPSQLLVGVLGDGATVSVLGIVAGALGGFALARLASAYFPDAKMPDAMPVAISAGVLLASSVIAALLPAVRAARIDAMQALRSE